MIAITVFMIGMGWDGLNQKHLRSDSCLKMKKNDATSLVESSRIRVALGGARSCWKVQVQFLFLFFVFHHSPEKLDDCIILIFPVITHS